MRQVILQIDITLDGFVAGPNGETDWVTSVLEIEPRTSVSGRTLTLGGSVFIIIGASRHVTCSVNRAGGPRVGCPRGAGRPHAMLPYAGATIASPFIQHSLVDDYRLRIHPVVLGSGKPLFKDIQARLPLTLVQTTSYQNGVTLLNYQPSKT